MSTQNHAAVLHAPSAYNVPQNKQDVSSKKVGKKVGFWARLENYCEHLARTRSKPSYLKYVEIYRPL